MSVVRGAQEARWKRKVAEAHKDFCECDSYLNHFKKQCTDTGVGTDDVDTVDEGLTDAILVEGIAAAELIEKAIEEAG